MNLGWAPSLHVAITGRRLGTVALSFANGFDGLGERESVLSFLVSCVSRHGTALVRLGGGFRE